MLLSGTSGELNDVRLRVVYSVHSTLRGRACCKSLRDSLTANTPPVERGFEVVAKGPGAVVRVAQDLEKAQL